MKKSINEKTADTSVIFSVTDLIRKRFSKKRFNEINPVRVNYINDNFENSAAPNTVISTSSYYCKTRTLLKVGTIVKFYVDAKASDGHALEYSIDVDYKNVTKWQKENIISVPITAKNISKFCQIRVNIRRVRNYQPHHDIDNSVIFSYQVM
jgi:hypothetical protein